MNSNTLKAKYAVYLDAIYGNKPSKQQSLVMRHAFCAGAAAGLSLLEETSKRTRMPVMMKHRAFLISEQALSGCTDAEEQLKALKLTPPDASQSTPTP